MSTIDEQRAAYRAYKASYEQDLLGGAGDSFAPLMAEPSAKTLALQEQAGDYYLGYVAADSELVSAADSLTDARPPPAGSSEAFVAGWRDRMRQELPIGYVYTNASDDVIQATLGEAFEEVVRRGEGYAYVRARGLSDAEMADKLDAAGAKTWGHGPFPSEV